MFPASRSGATRMSASPATCEAMPLVLAASRLMALSMASGPSSSCAGDLPPVGHLAQRRRVDRRGDFRRHRLHSRKDGHLGQRPAEAMRQVNRVLADISLVFQRRSDVDRRVGDHQRLRIGGHRHDEGVADPPAGPQPGGRGDHGAHQLIGVEAPLHQRLGAGRANQFDRLGCRRVGIGYVFDCVGARRSVRPLARPRRSSAAGRPGSARSGPPRLPR